MLWLYTNRIMLKGQKIIIKRTMKKYHNPRKIKNLPNDKQKNTLGKINVEQAQCFYLSQVFEQA